MINAGIFGVGMQMVNGLAGAYGSHLEGQMDKAYAEYQADISEINAKLKLQTQKDVLEQGKIQLGDFSRQVGEAIADSITAGASSGLVISEDGIDAIMRMGDRQSDEMRKSIENDAFAVGLEALGLKQTATGQRFSGRTAAANATATGIAQGFGTVGRGIVQLDKLGAFAKDA